MVLLVGCGEEKKEGPAPGPDSEPAEAPPTPDSQDTGSGGVSGGVSSRDPGKGAGGVLPEPGVPVPKAEPGEQQALTFQ